MPNLEELASRVEATAPEETRSLLVAAWNACQYGFVCDQYDIYRGDDVAVDVGREDEWNQFRRLLDAGGYIDAAMILVPEGWEYTLMNVNGYDEATLTNHTLERTAWSSGNSLALALAASALRSRALLSKGEKGE